MLGKIEREWKIESIMKRGNLSIESRVNDEWRYQICENAQIGNYVKIELYLLEEDSVIVPSQVDGIEVKEIGEYAFKGKKIKEVKLPKTIDTIGSHAFYDCRLLEKIFITDYLTEVADGAFKNCRSLSFIDITMIQERYTCLKNLLSEMNQRVTCYMHRKIADVKLVFPAYLHNYQENTMARIINQETYGAGAHYRETITKDGILYQEYDKHFYLASNVDEKEALYGIALSRLEYPYELREATKVKYETFIKENWTAILDWLLKTEQIEEIKWLGRYEEIGQEEMKEMLEFLQSKEEIELLSEMMGINQERFGKKKKSFLL